MKLQNITSIDYSISGDLKDIQTDLLIKELGEDVATTVASWYILKESTNQYEINELLVNEGVKDILKKGMDKINDAMTKGYSDIDAMKTKVVQGLKSKGEPGILSKLGEIAKRNAKYIKPAVMVAVVGASLLGMDTVSASEALNSINGMSPDEFQQYSDQMGKQFGEVNANGGQAPQEDQPTQYGNNQQNQAGNGTDANGVTNMDRAKANLARSSIGATVNGVEITKDMVLGAIKNGTFGGNQNLTDFMKDVYTNAPSAEQAQQYVKQGWEQGLMNYLSKLKT